MPNVDAIPYYCTDKRGNYLKNGESGTDDISRNNNPQAFLMYNICWITLLGIRESKKIVLVL